MFDTPSNHTTVIIHTALLYKSLLFQNRAQNFTPEAGLRVINIRFSASSTASIQGK